MDPKWGPFCRQNRMKIRVDFGNRKVGDLEGPRVAKCTLDTSKNKENHWRCCKFKLFTRFGLGLVFSHRGDANWPPVGGNITFKERKVGRQTGS